MGVGVSVGVSVGVGAAIPILESIDVFRQIRAPVAPVVDTDLAIRVYREVMQEIDPSPLSGLARQTVANARHVLRLMVRARRLGAAEVTKSIGEMMSSQWRVAEDSMRETASLYNQWYAAVVAVRDSSTMASR